MGSLQRMMVKEFPYWDINQSKWLNDLCEEGCDCVRNGPRIYIFFNSREKAERCMKKCEKRNISHLGILEDTFIKTFRVDILMNWKERRPSKIRKKENQILD